MNIVTRQALLSLLLFLVFAGCTKHDDALQEHNYYFSINIDNISIAVTQPLVRSGRSPEALIGEIKEKNIHLFAGRACGSGVDSCYAFWARIPANTEGIYQSFGFSFDLGQFSYYAGPNGYGGTVTFTIERVKPYTFLASQGIIKGTFQGKVSKQQIDSDDPGVLVDVSGSFSMPDNIDTD